MAKAGFEPAIPASERFQTQAFDCAATGIGLMFLQDIFLSDNYHVVLPTLLLHVLRQSTMQCINVMNGQTGNDSPELSQNITALRKANYNNTLIYAPQSQNCYLSLWENFI